MRSKTLIQYRADDLSAPGWEERKLMPGGGLTSLLWETIDYSGRLPAPGDRVRNYRQDEETGQVTHGKDGDWIVTSVQHFSSFETSDRIVVCQCQYKPIEVEWQQLNRDLPVSEMMQETSQHA